MLSDQDRKPMSSAVNWTTQIEDIAGEFRSCDTKESWLARAYDPVEHIYRKIAPSDKKRDLSFRHFKSIFYGHCKDPAFSIGQSVLSAAEQARIEKAKADARQLADTYRSAANALVRKDEDFYRNQVDALVSAARILSSMDSPGTEGGGK